MLLVIIESIGVVLVGGGLAKALLVRLGDKDFHDLEQGLNMKDGLSFKSAMN